MTIYAELKDWQVGIGALLGLLALMLAALWNAHLNRRRDVALRQDEMLTVAVALYGELLLLRTELAKIARIVASVWLRNSGNIPERIGQDYRLPEPILYPALAHKIGLLSPELVLAVTRFHAAYREASESLYPISRESGVRYSVLALLNPAISGVVEIGPALQKIETLANLTEAQKPDLGDAEEVQELEKLKWEK